MNSVPKGVSEPSLLVERASGLVAFATLHGSQLCATMDALRAAFSPSFSPRLTPAFSNVGVTWEPLCPNRMCASISLDTCTTDPMLAARCRITTGHLVGPSGTRSPPAVLAGAVNRYEPLGNVRTTSNLAESGFLDGHHALSSHCGAHTVNEVVWGLRSQLATILLNMASNNSTSSNGGLAQKSSSTQVCLRASSLIVK